MITETPPGVFGKLEWIKNLGHKYWYHVVMIGSLLLCAFLWQDNAKLSEEMSSLSARLRDYEGCRTESPYGDPPIRVTFSDGRVAFVNYYQTSFPGKETFLDSLSSHALFHAYERFLIHVKAAVYRELEAVELSYARTNRDEMASRILKRIQPVVNALELKTMQFEFLEFCEPASVSLQRRRE